MTQEHFICIPGMTMVKANKSYSGSFSGMQWKVCLAQDGLDVLCWPMPWNLNRTDDSLVLRTSVPATEEGLRQAEAWLEEQYRQDILRWDEARAARWI